MGVSTEFGDAQPFTHTFNSGNSYSSPFEVNVYGWPEDESGAVVGTYIGRAMVLGALIEDGEEPMPVLELDDGTGERVVTIGLFLGIVPVGEDEVSPTTHRMTYKDYMSGPKASLNE